MLFGLALLAGLVGYAVVDPLGLGDDAESDESVETSDAEDTTEDIDADGHTVTDLLTGETDDSGTDDTDGARTDDIISGTGDDDLIYGGDSETTINGGDGDDRLHGGDGDTTLNGDAGDDRLYAGDGYLGQSQNTLNGGDGNDTLYGSNEAENLLNGENGDDEIHMRGQDIATGGQGADSFHYSTEYNNGEISTITDYDATEDQIIVDYSTDDTGITEVPAPVVSIEINGDDAVILLDGEECMTVQGAANSLTEGDILLRETA